jgi:hypothetical protein
MPFFPSNPLQVPAPGNLRYGLFSVARGPLELPDRVRVTGASYDSDGCGQPRGWPADCAPSPTPDPKTIDPNIGEQELLPFVVYASLVCGTAGYTRDYLESKVRRKLLAVEQSAVEQALWSGVINGVTLGNKPTFQDNNAIGTGNDPVVLTAAATPRAAISALEQYATDNYGYEPVIHVETRVVAHLAAAGLIREGGQPYRTHAGTLLSCGDYPGTSNVGAAAAAGHAWMAITGQVTLWRDPEIFVPDLAQVMARTTNQMNALAERVWAATYDCFVAMIDVTL